MLDRSTKRIVLLNLLCLNDIYVILILVGYLYLLFLCTIMCFFLFFTMYFVYHLHINNTGKIREKRVALVTYLENVV